MSLSKTSLLSAALALSLGGCLGTKNRGVESVHQPVVERTDYALDLRAEGGGLAGGEQARLAGWLDAMRLGYGDRVSVDDGGLNPGARAEVGGVVAGYGLLLADEAPMSAAPVQPGAVRVVVSRMRASVPGCPDWSRDSSVELEAHASSNFGCAINANLAAMAANPGDLVRGSNGTIVGDPAVSTKAIQTYRKAANTGAGGLKAESAGGAK